MRRWGMKISVLTAAAILVSAPVFAQGQVEAAAAATRGQIIDLAGYTDAEIAALRETGVIG